MMEVLLVGAFGGVANEVLHWYGLRQKNSFPKYVKRPIYWIITICMICVGAGFAYLQLGPSETNLILPFELGLLAPIILKKTLTSNATPDGSMGISHDGEPSIKKFLIG